MKRTVQTVAVRYRCVFIGLWTIASAIRLGAQTTPPPTPPATTPRPPARTSAPRSASQVDSVIQLVKSGMSESLIIKTLQMQKKPANLTAADMVKLQNAGVPENIISVMIDPAASAAAAAAPPPPPPPPAPKAPPSEAALKAMKKRVIVDDFDYSTVMTSVQAVFGTNQDIGKGIRAMLTNRVSQQGRVIVVERQKIDSLMKEQDRDQGNRVKQGTGARVGRIVGADALLTGDITTFGRDDKKKNTNLATLAAFGGPLMSGAAAIFSAATAQDKAVVAITYRMIDAEDSEIIATGLAIGTSVRKAKAINALAAGFNKGGVGAGGATIDMSSSNFAETIIGEATMDCVNKLAETLNTQAEAMKKTLRAIEATVADISGNTLTITAGINDGVNEGDVFQILKIVREVRDPTTKEVLDRITEPVGEIIITSVRDRIATGTYQGGPKPQVSYLARRKI